MGQPASVEDARTRLDEVLADAPEASSLSPEQAELRRALGVA